MFKRTKMQPDPMKECILQDEDGALHYGKWLVGNTYEGWYIIKSQNPELKTPCILSQKEAKIVYFAPFEEFESNNYHPKRYIPKALLDEAFYGHAEVEDFRCTPDILCYL